ncbi:hypothetical protein UPYG_G00222160 [Umbra pygmaea]|uniref:Tyrosine-protein kinase ephrin type A/B receptor-like domain-containing protein n=1 Tax=Umbra pygmaea TaxID=75934 RepID=A0ABD0WBP1_UMBPY
MECRGVFSAIVAACLLGVGVSQTTAPTLAPAVMNTTIIENVTASTIFTETSTLNDVTLTTPTVLSPTPPGCSAFNTSTCDVCDPGYHSDNGSLLCSCCPQPGKCLSTGDCLPCSRGFFQPLSGQQHCLPCSQGFYTNSTGSPVCTACSQGSYSNSSGSESCQSCSPGFYTSQQNSTSCNPCEQGTFCNSSNCVRCQICPAGTESLQPAAKECTRCRPGMHKARLQSMCQICSSGFFQIQWGQENCNLCPENHYCPSPDVNPILCPFDAFCPEGSTAPGYCMETFFRKAGEECELAPVTIALLVIGGGVAVLFVILLVLRRRRDTDGELTLARQPLLSKERPQGRYYGIPCDAEPVYAGW